MRGKVLDVNSLSFFHSSLYISLNGNGYLDLCFFVGLQTFTTVGLHAISTGNIMVAILSNILQLVAGSDSASALRNRIVGEFQIESAGTRIIRTALLQDEVILSAANAKKPPLVPLKLSLQSASLL